MKKYYGTVILASLLVFGASSANASPFTLNLDALGIAGLQQYVNPVTAVSEIQVADSLSVENPGTLWSTIDQSFGDDGILNDGDTFTEYGFLGVLSWDGGAPTGDNFNLFDGTDEYQIYIEFNDLAGTIYNYDAGLDTPGDTTIYTLGNVADDSYDITFDAGVGDVRIYLENLSTNIQTDLAALELVEGAGTSPTLVLDQTEGGNFALTLDFDSYLADFWNVNGMTFGDWEALYPDSITLGTQNIDATVKVNPEGFGYTTPTDPTDDGFSVQVLNDGSVYVNAVPEPATMLLFGTGLLGLAGVARRKRS